jgi:hypothetical protein
MLETIFWVASSREATVDAGKRGWMAGGLHADSGVSLPVCLGAIDDAMLGGLGVSAVASFLSISCSPLGCSDEPALFAVTPPQDLSRLPKQLPPTGQIGKWSNPPV